MNISTKILFWCLPYSFSLASTAQDFQLPPKNPWHVESPWPIYHQNSARQSYTDLAGPTEDDSVVVKVLKNIKGGTSPWTYFSEPYPNGQRAMLQSNATHYTKILDSDSGPKVISKIKIDSDWLKSFSYTQLQIKGNQWYTFDPKENPEKDEHTRLFKIGDKNPKNPYSPLEVKKVLDFGDLGIGKTQHAGVNYLGQIVFASDNEKGKTHCTVGIISQELELLAKMDISPIADNEIFGHNGFPIDENNSFYLVTTHRLIRVDWDGELLSVGFEAKYDFVKDGPTGRWAEGSGTTPTLMGFGEGYDQLVVMADGHAENNFVAFWREIPGDWQGIAGEDIRLAGKIRLPAAKTFSNKFQSIENSPTVYGYDAAIAQYNGFLGQRNNPITGVQKVHWNTDENVFEIAWVNTDINMNGVLTYSVGSDMVYGSGREDHCNYYYYGLDWGTGKLQFRQHLGRSCRRLFNPYDDPGDQNIIDEEGNIFFTGGGSLVKLEIVRERGEPTGAVGPSHPVPGTDLSPNHLYPNPTGNFIQLPAALADLPGERYILNASGEIIRQSLDQKIYVGDLEEGIYFLKAGANTARFVKQ